MGSLGAICIFNSLLSVFTSKQGSLLIGRTHTEPGEYQVHLKGPWSRETLWILRKNAKYYYGGLVV